MPDTLRQFKAEVFRALGHPSRVAIVELLKDGETGVGRIGDAIGLEEANVSQHLAVLRNSNIVESRKEGNQVLYRLRDPVFGVVLDRMREYFFSHMDDAMEEVRAEKRRARQEGRK